MAFKRALVVDDSKSARVALQKLLEQHDLIVEFAESGEEALDFLKHQLVDVIFMDHHMPGMDGLEAVAAIKRNPRTATIPVMMYTTREGEVYVGQARALGAVGVLPKQVQPGVLFQMLLDLGLVKDRRAQAREEENPDDETDAADEVDRQYEQQALGMSVQALVTRILEDQHLSLRSDILRSHKDFAKQVAAEIFRKQAEERAADEQVAERRVAEGRVAEWRAPAAEHQAHPSRHEPERPRSAIRSGLATALTLAALVFAFLFAQMKNERDGLAAELARISSDANARLSAARDENSALLRQTEAALHDSEARLEASLRSLEWAMNQSVALPFDAIPFDDGRAAQLGELLDRLALLDFEGTVTLESHLGTFCLDSDVSGGYRLPDPAMPVDECAFIGHPLDGAPFPSDRQSPGFAAFLQRSPLLRNPGIEVQLIAHERLDSLARYDASPGVSTAGEWNRIAEMNNRVVFRLDRAGNSESLAEAG